MGATDVEDRLDIADTLYRFAAGLDEKDPALFASVWAADAIHDFSAGARALGLEFGPVVGRDAIVDTFIPALAPHTTTHTISNPRIELHGDTATAITLTEAVHLTKPDHARQLLAKNRYDVELRREAAGWKITRLKISNVWWSGDISVLTEAL